jgi:transcription initiation factor TFIIIB Brf1 subunit/transcription initiation factor TFIIB
MTAKTNAERQKARDKRQHWQKFTWELCCADCGCVIKDVKSQLNGK